jgi:hypothetical protein
MFGINTNELPQSVSNGLEGSFIPQKQREAWEKNPKMCILKVISIWVEGYPPSLEHETTTSKDPQLVEKKG